MHYALYMDKLTAGIRANLLQHLLSATQGTRTAASDTATAALQRIQPGDVSPLLKLDSANASTRITLPPALRQLLAEHAQLDQLLPQLRALQNSMSTTTTQPGSTVSPANAQLLSALLPVLTQQLAVSSQQLTPQQLKQFVSQWFSFHPGQALSSPPPAQNTTWLTQLGPLLQWLLVQRSAHQPLTRLLQQGAPANATPPASITPPTLAALSSLLLGSVQDIRLSQVHLADTNAQQQPEYYLVLPYESGDKPQVLEWLLRKQAQTGQQAQGERWKFSLRFTTQRYGPILVKGTYATHDEQNGNTQPLTQLRFYLQGDGGSLLPAFENALSDFTERLAKSGIGKIKHEVHLGVVPESLAPTAQQLVKRDTPQRGPYG